MTDRIITGLWQLAGGHDQRVDIESCSRVMEELVSKSLSLTFDMADHYGPAEQVVGRYRSRISEYTLPQPKTTFFTKWCPQPEVSTAEETQAAVDLARSRMGVDTIDRLQFHIWDYTDSSYLSLFCHLQSLQSSGKVNQLALTNTDTAHLLLLINSGFALASNQVSVSVLDRRILNPNGMADACLKNGVDLLAYGVLLGGFLNEKWLGAGEPRGSDLGNWSLKKYKRFIDVSGGWIPFQRVLSTLDFIAKKYTSPGSPITISTIAIAYVLSLPAVTSVIIGSRLSPLSSVANAESNQRALEIVLDEEDLQMIGQAQKELKDIPGDSGDEYRRAPFLTAKGDLSDHLDKEGGEGTRRRLVEEATRRGERVEVSSGSPYEALAGYCRAVRLGSNVHISGTTATSPLPSLLPIAGGSSAASQLTHIFDIVTRALHRLNGSLSDVVRTRIFLSDLADVKEVSRERGRAFAREGIRPANTLVGAKLVGEFKVEMEVEARIGGRGVVLRV